MRGERRRAAAPRREDGLTIVEMLVALIILGIVFSAVGAALVNLTRASVTSERRVQATAILTELHERLQALDWDFAVVYEEEMALLDEVGDYEAPVGGSPATFDGEELVSVEAGCSPIDPPECGNPSVPRVFQAELEGADGRTYEVYQAVTWADRDGVAPRTTKRFTTIVSWKFLGREVTQRLESERTPTGAEQPDGEQSIGVAFDVIPSSVQLDDGGFLAQDMTLDVIFPVSDLAGVTGEVSVTFRDSNGDDVRFVLEQMGSTRVFREVVEFDEAAPVGPFDLPGQSVLIEWTQDGVARSSNFQVSFVEEPTETEVKPEIITNSLTESRVTVDIGKIFALGSADRLCQTLTLQVDVEGLEEGGGVIALYNPASAASMSFNPPEGGVTGSGDTFTQSFAAGTLSPWSPTTDQPIPDVFRVYAVSAGGTEVSSVENSETVTFQRVTSPNGDC